MIGLTDQAVLGLRKKAWVMTKQEQIFEEVTARIINNLESAGSWKRPWGFVADGSVPHNASTGRGYSGINFFNLGFKSQAWGCSGWLTFSQAKKLGGQVPKRTDPNGGCEYVVFKSMETAKNKQTGEEEKRFVRKTFPVWNVAQISGLSGLKKFSPPLPGDGAANALADAVGATVVYGGHNACFNISKDSICMPSSAGFVSPADHDSTLLHELVHWTGHQERLARDMSGGFGSDSYAFEELVAEIGAAMAGAVLGIHYEGLQHEAYIKSWLTALRGDVALIGKAASLASKAVIFLDDLRGQSDAGIEAA
jgi:antirestriction protein ArdC